MAMYVAMMAVGDTLRLIGQTLPTPREPRKFTATDTERLAKAEAKRAHNQGGSA